MKKASQRGLSKSFYDLIAIPKEVLIFTANREVGGLIGQNHYALAVDLGFLPPGTNFISHFTIQCGNDDLMGQGTTPVPEPSTILLFGAGLIGSGMLSWKKFVLTVKC